MIVMRPRRNCDTAEAETRHGRGGNATRPRRKRDTAEARCRYDFEVSRFYAIFATKSVIPLNEFVHTNPPEDFHMDFSHMDFSHMDLSHTDLKDYKDRYAALRLHIPGRVTGLVRRGVLYRVANSVAIFKILKIRVRKKRSV